jgi:NAD(P)H-hydrate epimerase
MLEPLYSAGEMRAAEAGHDVEELMARAGRAVAEEAMRRFPDARVFAAKCGKGANGGDGRIAVDVLTAAGRTAVVLEPGVPIGEADVVVDALFGTGFHGTPRDEAAREIENMNGSGRPVVAVDLPSGVDASTGEVAGAAVRAALTVTFHGRKVGHVVAPGRFHRGEVAVADIGLEPVETEHGLVTREILARVPRRRAEDNKYTAGAVVVVGGSPGMTGAPCLAAEAAFRADAGYVTVAVPASSLPIFEVRLLETVKAGCTEDSEGRLGVGAADAILGLAERAGAVALGPGLGRTAGTKQLVRRLLDELDRAVVVDADGLWELESVERRAPTVLTPHAGELARLLGRGSAWVSAHRLAAVREAADRFACVVVLKGADTLVAAPGRGVLVCETGTPALATAGTGDVLTGIVAAFLAKGMEGRIAAAAAAVAHGLAATLAPQEAGLVASDVIDALPQALA